MEYKNTYKFESKVSPLFAKIIFNFTKGKKVLDVGCGTGEYLKYFSKESLGLDVSELNLHEADKKGLRTRQVDLNTLTAESLNEKFEVVFCSQVLEHLERPIDTLKVFHDLLEKDGILILSLPNEYSLIHAIYPYFTSDGNHLFSFSTSNTKELLNYTNFNLLKIYYDFYTALTKKLKLNGILQVLNILPDPLKLPCAWSVWYVAKKS